MDNQPELSPEVATMTGMEVWQPDPDWYLDHVIVPGGPDHVAVGPVRVWQASWEASVRELRRHTPAALGRAVRLAAAQGLVLTHAQARDCGVDRASSRRLVGHDRWHAAARGVLAVVARPRICDETSGFDVQRRVHTLAATAACLLRPGHVVTGRSAAVLHGLPLLQIPPLAELTARTTSTLGRRSRAVIRSAAIAPVDLELWYGAPITTLARTVVDLARHSRCDGLAAADAALREKLTNSAELVDAVGRSTGWPGVRQARDIVAMSSGLAESPLESLTRLVIQDAGLPEPELQVVIVDAANCTRYRVDMLWRERRVVLEADGRVKYRDGQLWREKRRQEQLERLGYRVVRVLWDDVVNAPDETAKRIRWALSAPLLPNRPH